MASLDNPAAKGVTFEAYGPERFLLSDLIDWTDEVVGLPSIEDLGVKLNKVKDEMPWVLDPFRAFRYHTYYSLADKPVIHPLHPITGFQERSLQKELDRGY